MLGLPPADTDPVMDAMSGSEYPMPGGGTSDDDDGDAGDQEPVALGAARRQLDEYYAAAAGGVSGGVQHAVQASAPPAAGARGWKGGCCRAGQLQGLGGMRLAGPLECQGNPAHCQALPHLAAIMPPCRCHRRHCGGGHKCSGA